MAVLFVATVQCDTVADLAPQELGGGELSLVEEHAGVQSLETEGEQAMEGMFQDYMRSFSKQYDSEEEYRKRLGVFSDSVRFVDEWNGAKEHSFRVAINEFADLTGEEFAERFLGLEEDSESSDDNTMLNDRATSLVQEDSGEQRGAMGFLALGEDDKEGLRNGAMHQNSGKELPKTVDWAHQGRTGSVYKQGVCAACYTFATNAAIEGQYFLKTGKKMPELSDQEILSCSRPYGNHGCIGGNMEKSYHYIMHAQEHNGGMTLAKDYSYEGSETPCKAGKFKTANVKLAGYRKISKGSEADLMDAVSQRPVAVGFDAHHPAFKLYSDGVFDIDYCTTHLTHAMLVVGYGTSSDGQDYWKLQNSWGKNWGEDGFGRVTRGKNMCSVSNLASYPVIEDEEQWTFDV
jgi:cathepsin L